MKHVTAYGCEDVKARSFVSLMDLYESNYIKLKKLIPLPETIQHAVISPLHGHMDLYLNIVERSKYTTTLYLSYCFPTEHGLQMEPNLKVRIYHDAQLAEVMAGHLHHGRLILDNLPAYALQEKWRLNRFLNRWLGYCLKHGYSFSGKPKAAVLKLV